MTHIGIFWDYENCPPPRGFSGYELVANIKRAISDLGDEITIFKAYMDIHEVISHSSSCQSQLQAAGVTLVHCPHACRKEAADRVLCVDLMIFALEHSQPTSIVLISGDKDFSYATSRLRMKGHQIYLIHPSYGQTASSILNVASGTREWSSILYKGAKFVKVPIPDAVRHTLLVVDKHRTNPFGNDSSDHASPTTSFTATSKSPGASSYPPPSFDNTLVGPGQGPRSNCLSIMPTRNVAPPAHPPYSQPSTSRITDWVVEPAARSRDSDNKYPQDSSLSSTISKPPTASDTSSPFGIGALSRFPLAAYSSPPQCTINNMLFLKPDAPPIPSSFSVHPRSASRVRKSKFKPIESARKAAEAFRSRQKIDANRERRQSAKATKIALPVLPAAPLGTSCAANLPAISGSRATSFGPLIDVLLLERKRGKMSTPILTLELILKERHPNALVEFGTSDLRDYVERAQTAGVVFFSDVVWKDDRGYVSLRNPQLYGDNLVIKARAALSKRMMKAKIDHAAEHFLQACRSPGLLVGDGNAPHFSKDGVTSLLGGFMSGMRSLRSSKGPGTMARAEPMDWKTHIGKTIASNEALFKIFIDSAEISGLVRKAKGEDSYNDLELHPDIC